MNVIAGKELDPYLEKAKVSVGTRTVEVWETKEGYKLHLKGEFTLAELEALVKIAKKLSK